MKVGRQTWKYLAAAAMLLDHTAYLLLPERSVLYWIFRFVGRLTAPTMCYFLAEGYQYTSSKGKYVGRLALFALLSQPAYSLAKYGRIQFTDWNVMFTLLLALLAVWFWDNGPIPANRTLMVGALVLLSSLGDWGVIAPVWVLLFFARRSDRQKQAKAFAAVAAFVVGIGILYEATSGGVWYRELWQVGMFLFLPFFFRYDGAKGRASTFSKWFFYGFYPVHLLILVVLANRIGV